MIINKIKKILALVALCVTTPALAQYTMIVPQKPGGGTSVWATIVAKGIEQHLGEQVVVRHIPGAKDIPGFDEFHNKLRFDDKTIMVSHGGNGISYLVDKVDYDYSAYDSIGMMNLNIAVGMRPGLDIYNDTIKMAGGAGLETDGMAVAMLLCGNLPTVNDYLDCWNKRVIWVNGLSGSERRLAFTRRELNVVRESTAAWIKFYKNNSAATLWFNHGVYNFITKKQEADPNYPTETQFESVFRSVHGTAPVGPFYEAYKLSRMFRDVLQKALWVNKGNPNTEKLRSALRDMLNDTQTVALLEKDTGKYTWIIGNDGNEVVGNITNEITANKLKTLTAWHDAAYGYGSVYKPGLVK